MTTKQYRELHPMCEICEKLYIVKPSDETHHIKTRGAGGKDEPENYIALCLPHHNEMHNKGRWWFSDKYNLRWEKLMVRKV